MTRKEIIDDFRVENPDITINVISDALLNVWCKKADKEVCAITRCIIDQNGTVIETAENDTHWDLTAKITKFYDIDEWPGGGVSYDDDRLTKTTIAELDDESPSWRTRSAGTPKKYYRRGKWLYLDRPVDSNIKDIRIYSVLISDNFDDDDKTPYNGLTYLEPFHDAIGKYLQWKGKAKKGKPEEAGLAKTEFFDYCQWMKKMIGGGKYTEIRFEPKV